MNTTLDKIAREHCHVPTLETRNSDSLDFHAIAVWGLKSALEAAYVAGTEQPVGQVKGSTPEANPHESILEVADVVEGRVYLGYSGRGMFGQQCTGIVCPNPLECVEEAAARGVRGAQFDSMGLGYIVYWPNISSEPEEGDCDQ